MSFRAIKFSSFFNRSKDKEHIYEYFQSLFYEDLQGYYDDDRYGWWDYEGSGSVTNMEQYHQMHLLTLLRLLTIRTAIEEANTHGW